MLGAAIGCGGSALLRERMLNRNSRGCADVLKFSECGEYKAREVSNGQGDE